MSPSRDCPPAGHSSVRSEEVDGGWESHGTSPYEQNTQHSPDKGRETAPHATHSKASTQTSGGTISGLTEPQLGHTRLETRSPIDSLLPQQGDRFFSRWHSAEDAFAVLPNAGR